MANQLIQKLLDAEQEADVIVRRARENWAKKIKEAQIVAEEEVKRFKDSEEAKFQRELQENQKSTEVVDHFEEQIKSDIELIKAQYKKHRDSAVATLVSGVVRVDFPLTEKEKRQIRLRFDDDA